MKPTKSLLPLMLLLCASVFLTNCLTQPVSGETLSIDSPMTPPAWALMQRELLMAKTKACETFFDKYFDHRGYLKCIERWGGNDGPDDAIENINDWPLLHALGAPDVILEMTNKAWEGHLLQYTEAKTSEVPMAREGMYYKEFPVAMDWLHNGEGLTVFNLLGLSDPKDCRFQQRVRRFAGFYMNEDPDAPNYDSKHKIIRSMFNGSRGPLLRKATALDWAGDPIEINDQFILLHGENSYEQMLEHFQDYNDIIGDHPQNLAATSLAANAYMLQNSTKYKRWLLEYVDAWRQRTLDNGGIIPSNIGLDGTIGGATDGKWYGGVYGWGFTVAVPGTDRYANRITIHMALIGFGNALLLTGDQKYVDVWDAMIDKINSNAKTIDGKKMYPTMHGDHGWYGWQEQPWLQGAREVYYWSMNRSHLERVKDNPWFVYLAGGDPGYPERVLQEDFATLRRKSRAMHNDPTTPKTRLSDNPMAFNPASITNLCNLMWGAIQPCRIGALLHARLRYFDPEQTRSGIPRDVAALVEKLTDKETVVTLVNINQTESRKLIVQGGAYGEHQCMMVSVNNQSYKLDSPYFSVHLAPGAGAQMTIQMKRYANQPSLSQPWDRQSN